METFLYLAGLVPRTYGYPKTSLGTVNRPWSLAPNWSHCHEVYRWEEQAILMQFLQSSIAGDGEIGKKVRETLQIGDIIQI